jgi:hypothetical protein
MKGGNGMKKWVKIDGKYYLIFSPFYEDKTVAVLYQDTDGDWAYNSELTDADSDFVGTKDTCLHDAKLEVEDQIYNHYEDERNYYQELLDKFIEN